MINKCIVTGGCGFIGSHLVDHLISKNFKVIVLDNLSTGRMKNLNKRAEFHKVDLSRYGHWKKYFKDVKYVFHLAGLAELVSSIKNYDKYYYSNIAASFNVFQASKENNCKKIIYTASSTCYGKPKKYPTPENEKINTLHPYAVTKFLGEEVLTRFGKIFNIPVVSARLFNVYGPRVRGTKGYGAVFTVFLSQKYHNKPFTVVGSGKQKRDFTYIEDIVTALFKLATNRKVLNGIYNIGSGKSVSVNKIVEYLGGKKISIPKRPGEPDMTFANISKIKKKINWSPKYGIKDGIKIMLANIEDYKKQPLWDKKKIKVVTSDRFKFLSKD